MLTEIKQHVVNGNASRRLDSTHSSKLIFHAFERIKKTMLWCKPTAYFCVCTPVQIILDNLRERGWITR